MEVKVQPRSQGDLPRREVMQTPDEVAAMLRLKSLGWGIKRIARELGCSHMTVRRYVTQGGWLPYRGRGRPRRLAGHEDWVAERFRRHAGNADVVRQELLAEKGIQTQPAHGRARGGAAASAIGGGGAGDDSFRDAAGQAAADRFRRAPGDDRRRDRQGLLVRRDARLLAAAVRPSLSQ